MSDIEQQFSPRDRARREASVGALQLMRLMMALGIVEIVAIVLGLTGAVTPAMAHAGNAVRALLALATFMVGRSLQGWANVLGVGLWLGLGRGFAMLSLIVGLVRALGIGAPAGIPDEVWPGLIATLAHVGTVGALALIVFVVSRFAAEADLIGAGRHLAWAALPLISALVAGVGFLEPTMLPVWWLGGALALATPWALCVARVLDWARALLPTLIIAATLTSLMMFEVDPRVSMGLSAIAAIIIAGAFPRAPLAALNMLLGEVAAPAPTRTFIRRLLDGPIDPEASRLGSQIDASNAEESLALAYRELGIEPRPPSSRLVPVAATVPTNDRAPLEAMGPMAKLEPISRRAPLVVVPERPPIDVTEREAWSRVGLALDRVFLGFVLRASIFVAVLMLAKTPLIRELPSLSLVPLFAAGVVTLVGLVKLRALPKRARSRSALPYMLVACVVMLGLDVAVALAFAFAREALGWLITGATVAWLTLTLATIAQLAMSFRDVAVSTRRSRALVPTVVLGAYTLFAAIAADAATDREILASLVAVPAGVAAAVLGTVFFIAMLWLINDARTALRDWDTRAARALRPPESDPQD